MIEPTAQFLGKYQTELADAGIDPVVINDIVRHAAFHLHDNDGIGIRSDAQAAK